MEDFIADQSLLDDNTAVRTVLAWGRGPEDNHFVSSENVTDPHPVPEIQDCATSLFFHFQRA